MTIKQATARVVAAFIDWKESRGHRPDEVLRGDDAFLFYLGLESSRSPLLDFRATGDKWQTVHTWLRSRRLVSD